MSTDTLSDVLRAVRLTGACFFDVQATAPWVAEAPAGRDIADLIMPGSEHVIEYHLLVAGTCYGSLVGETAECLGPGDLIIFPQGDSHIMSSAPGMRAVPDLAIHHRPQGSQLPFTLQPGGGGEPATLICGFLGCDARPFNPLLATLPRVILVRQQQLADRPLAALLQVAVAESRSRRAGSECVLSRLSELLFVEAVRLYVETIPPEQSGWLAGLRDPHVGRALAALHDRPSHSWTLDDLAQEVGLSKSLLAERFQHFVGIAPMQYLAKWRMQLAAERLRNTTETLAEIADRIGYGSESAFSRAFKRLVGVAPNTFREGDTATGGEDPASPVSSD
jgi:AraC-like DNA-binding protein